MTGSNRHLPSPLAYLLALLLALTCTLPALAADVWVNTGTGVYHCPGGQYYGNTKRGRFTPEREAVQQGYRPAYDRACSSGQANTTRQQVIQSLAPTGAAATVSTHVWINTNSRVYHCPGTRYYGATKSGRYASEAVAVAGGNRPAYGARCN